MSKILEIRDHKNNLYTVKTFYKDVEGLEGQLTSLKDELNLSIKNNINKVETSITEYVKESINTNNTSLDNQMKDLKEQVDSVSTIKENIETIVEVPLGKYRINAGKGLKGGGLLKNNPTLNIDYSNKVRKGSVTIAAPKNEYIIPTWRKNIFKMDQEDYCIIHTSAQGSIIRIDKLLGFAENKNSRLNYDPNKTFDHTFRAKSSRAAEVYIELTPTGWVSFGVDSLHDTEVTCTFDWFLFKRGE